VREEMIVGSVEVMVGDREERPGECGESGEGE
jgi:hypothetical protein